MGRLHSLHHDPMKENLARQQAAYVESHGVPMPRAMQAHALTQMFALQSLLFKDSEDESNTRRELHDPDYWHALVPGSSTDPDELRAALLALPRSAAAPTSASASASASSPPFFDPEEVVGRLREDRGTAPLSSFFIPPQTLPPPPPALG